jgi:hypothetical protein
MKSRLPLMALAAVSLLAALWAGLVRLGWALPRLPVPLAGLHGAFMVAGFLGTLISLERAVALAHRGGRYGLAYLAPLASGLGGAALLLGLPLPLAQALLLLGGLGLVGIFLAILRLQFDTPHTVMGVGALLLAVGNALWLAGRPISAVVPWWAGFLVLTIAGERLELGRVLLLARSARRLFGLAAGVFLLGLALTVFNLEAGMRVAGLGLLALAAWLLRFDLARRTIRQRGLTRFIAACLLPGYAWLGFGGLLWVVAGGRYAAGPIYDALLHSLFLGFVMSMIFGHAPVIVPAVAQRPVAYTPGFYAHLALLHASLVVRVAGDLGGSLALRQWGGLFNEVAVLLFLGVTIVAATARTPAPRSLPTRRAPL